MDTRGARSPGRRRIVASVVLAGAVVALFYGLVFSTRQDELAASEAARARETSDAPARLAEVPGEEAADGEKRSATRAGPELEPAPPSATVPATPTIAFVLDAATDEPIPALALEAGRTRADSDVNGKFVDSNGLDADARTWTFRDELHGTHVRSLAASELERTDEAWIARIAIGPTFRLALPAREAERLAELRARLVEVTADGVAHFGSWQLLRPHATPYFRYDNPWEPNDAGSRLRIELRDEAGTWFGASTTPVTGTIGLHPGAIHVELDRRLGKVQGRVLDTNGVGVKRARVSAVPITARLLDSDTEWPEDFTEGDGSFELRGLASGAWKVVARPRRGETPAVERLELSPGAQHELEFVVPAAVYAGMISGRLESRAGRAFDVEQVVRLRATDGRDFELFDVSSRAGGGPLAFRQYGPSAESDGAHVFEFNEVPEGTYEVSVVARDGWDWDPPIQTVTPPNEELRFTRLDDEPTRRVRFAPFDAESGEALVDFGVQLQQGALWNDEPVAELAADGSLELPAGRDFTFTLFAAGHVPARGTSAELAASSATADNTLVARLGLARGYGLRLLLRDVGLGFDADDRGGRVAALERPPIAGADILVDGRRAGSSDAHGAFVLELPTAPAHIAIQAPGWRVVPSRHFVDGRVRGEARDVVVWMTRE